MRWATEYPDKQLWPVRPNELKVGRLGFRLCDGWICPAQNGHTSRCSHKATSGYQDGIYCGGCLGRITKRRPHGWDAREIAQVAA